MITLGAIYQQTKTLVDPVTGTYQTVLTIDPSLDQRNIEGTYSCTVENDRGESSEIVFVSGECCVEYFPHICLLFFMSSGCLCVLYIPLLFAREMFNTVYTSHGFGPSQNTAEIWV